MRVKICGLMRQQDVNTALENGADAVGFVVASPSPRNLPLARARSLMRSVPVFATKVNVTASADLRTIARICNTLKPDALQLHHYSPSLIRRIRKKHPEVKLILATAMRNRLSINEAKRSSTRADAILADTLGSTGMGGTGIVHDWELTAKLRGLISPKPLIMAGGLTPENIGSAIRKVRPFAVDVSSGIERRIGVKDPVKIREFILNAKETVI